MAGFPWSECQVRKLTTSHCTTYHLHIAEMTVKVAGRRRFFHFFFDQSGATHTGMCTVTTCCTKDMDAHIYLIVRKGGGFFYGKSSNENYT